MAPKNGRDGVEKPSLSTRNNALAFGTQAKTPIVGALEAADSNQLGL
jgi:hypothetical protein